MDQSRFLSRLIKELASASVRGQIWESSARIYQGPLETLPDCTDQGSTSTAFSAATSCSFISGGDFPICPVLSSGYFVDSGKVSIKGACRAALSVLIRRKAGDE